VDDARIPGRPGGSVERSEMDLGWKFWLAFVGVCIAVAIGGWLVFAIFAGALVRWGIIGAFIVVGLIAIGFAYVYDRREQKRYDELIT
jgi:hypothetical protein